MLNDGQEEFGRHLSAYNGSPSSYTNSFEHRAAEILGLDREQADRLFYYFPYSSRGTPKYVEDVLKHIDNFIEQNS